MYNKIIVNKRYKLKENYIPKDMIEIYEPTGDKLDNSYINMLDKEAYQHFKVMQSAAKGEGFFIWIDSSYRSFIYQQEIFKDCVKNKGKKEASIVCAEPGTSEHQTGLAIDIIFSRNGKMYLEQKESDSEITWLMENSYLFGYILRYPLGKENITGYIFEPWHYRYVGEDLAKKLFKEDITLEEYYNTLEKDEIQRKLIK